MDKERHLKKALPHVNCFCPIRLPCIQRTTDFQLGPNIQFAFGASNIAHVFFSLFEATSVIASREAQKASAYCEFAQAVSAARYDFAWSV